MRIMVQSALALVMLVALVLPHLMILDLRRDLDRQSLEIEALKSAPLGAPQAALELEESEPTAPAAEPSGAAQTLKVVQAAITRRLQGPMANEEADLREALKKDGPEGLRARVLAIDQKGAKGARYLIGGALEMLERSKAEPEEIDAELRTIYGEKEGSAFLRAITAGVLARRGDDSLVREFLKDEAGGRLRSSDPKIRTQSVVDIVQTRSPLATPVLLATLSDGDFRVRATAAEGLGYTGGEELMDTLVSLQNDDSPAVRDGAAKAVERIRTSWKR